MNREIDQLISKLQSLLPRGSTALLEIVTKKESSLAIDLKPTSDTHGDADSQGSPCDDHHAPKSREWTTSDDWLLRLGWGAVNIESIGSMLDRQVSEIRNRTDYHRSRLKTGAWQPDELRLLGTLYGSRTNLDLEITLLRSQAEIATAAKSMRLSKNHNSKTGRRVADELRRGQKSKRNLGDEASRGQRSSRRAKMPRWTAEEVQRLITLYGNHDNQSISSELGRSITSIANKAWQLGITKSVEQLAKIGRSNVNHRHTTDTDTDSTQDTTVNTTSHRRNKGIRK